MSILRTCLCWLLLAFVLTGCGQSSNSATPAGTPNVGSAENTIALQARRVAVVYSDTTAKHYFDEFAFGQLFTAMQHQAMQAGLPYDLLSESDLVDTSVLAKYDALIIPLMSHIDSSIRTPVINALLSAQSQGMAIITSSEFLTYDQNNQPFGESYLAMIDVLGLTPKSYQVGVPAKLRIERNDHPITARYLPNEVLDDYAETWFAEFSPVTPSDAITLVSARVHTKSSAGGAGGNDGVDSEHAILQVLERDGQPGRVVHFANSEFLADRNLVWTAIRWAVYGDVAPVSLLPSRAPSIFIARNDMDQAMIPSGLFENEIPLLGIIKDWKRDFDFVGSYYIDIGNNPAQGEYTDWSVSAPLYAQYLALGNEFGTHSWTHPHYTSQLSDTELEFEFNQSRQEISAQLGIEVIGGAVPGNPEDLNVVENLNQWFDYFSGRSITGSTGYRSGYGYLKPEHNMRYFNLNMTPDFGLIDFLNYTPQQARKIWRSEFDALELNAELPVMHWLWHDYGPTAQAKTGRYSKAMFEDTIDYAFKAGAEFATLADYHQRLSALETAKLTTGVNGDITAIVEGDGVGQFALKLDTGKRIASVSNWYAYSDEAVFMPDNGGEFHIVTGATPADVTRIVALPMRARLLSVSGNSNELEFSFNGQGDVTIELSPAMQNNTNVIGADSFKYVKGQLVLSFANAGQHAVSINAIAAVNSPPVATSGSISTSFATPVAATLNASDPNQDAVNYQLTSQPAHGTLSGTAPNLVYTPDDRFSGVDTFKFIANDGALDSAAANFTVTVGSPVSANSSPVANKAVYNTISGQGLSLVLSGADNEGEALQYTVVTGPTNGVLSGNAPAMNYQPNAGFVGVDEFTFSVSDGTSQSPIEKVVLHVSAQPVQSNGTVSNEAASAITIDARLPEWSASQPFGIDPQESLGNQGHDWKQAWMSHDVASYFIAYEQYQAAQVGWRNQIYFDTDTNRSTGFTGFANEYPLGADFLIEGGALMEYTGTGDNWLWRFVATLETASRGNVVEMAVPRAKLGNSLNMELFYLSINSDNKTDHYPDDAASVDAIPYTRQFSYSVTANTNPVNAAPVASPLQINTANNADVAILLTGFDHNSDVLSYSLSSQPAHGTLTGAAPNLIYMPNAGYTGGDSFRFNVSDGELGSNTATVSITVVGPPPVDGIPVAHNKSVAIAVNATANIVLSGSDYEGTALTYSVQQNPAHGVLTGQAPNMTYKANTGYQGADSFTYRVNDGTSNSEIATINITVGTEGGNTNTPPAANNQALVAAFETAVGVTLSATDADGDTLTYTVVSQPTAGTLSGTAPALTFTPFTAATGTDSFTFKVNDGEVDSALATVSINIEPPALINQAPTAIGQSLNGIANTPINITLSGTDPEQSQLGFQITKPPIGGALTGEVPNLVYTPAGNFSGIDRLYFKVSDGSLSSEVAIITFNVGASSNSAISNAVTALNVDGDISDWVGLTPFDNDPDDVSGIDNPLNWRSMIMAHDNANFYFMFRNDGPFSLSWGHGMYIDVDGKTNTGFRDFNDESPIGADYLIEGNSVHRYTGTGNDWSWTYIGSATSALENDVLEFALPRSMLANPTNLQLYLRASNEPFGGNIIDHYPDKALDASAALSERLLQYTTGP